MLRESCGLIFSTLVKATQHSSQCQTEPRLLVDGGGNTTEAARRIGETVVSEYLWWRGLSQIDYVLATHADADHIDGLNDVLKNFSVRAALIARRPADDPEFQKFSQTLTETDTYSETIEAGDVIRFGDVEVNVLWPPAGGDKWTNNDSIVLRIQFGERSILFTGDIEQAAERALLASQQQLRADLVKVPHHGSKTSSTEGFVLATKPNLAIISVGRNSRFGHPHKEVVERWQANGATVLTTGDNGTITITTDGHDLKLKTFISHKKAQKAQVLCFHGLLWLKPYFFMIACPCGPARNAAKARAAFSFLVVLMMPRP